MTHAAPDVLVIGDALLDVLARPVDGLRFGADTPATVRVGPGGQGANLAVRLARQGLAVELVAAMGDDAAGRILRDAIVGEGVTLTAVPGRTGSVLILLDRDGERTMLSDRVPFAAPATIRVHARATWLMLSGYVLLEPGGLGLARRASATGSHRVLVGCAVPDPSLAAWADAARAFRPTLVILNRAEAGALVPDVTRLSALATALAADLRAGVVITDADGAVAEVDGRNAAVRSPAASIADTTGAGDAFASTLVASLHRGGWPAAGTPLETALADATAVAVEVAGASGAQARIAAEAR